MASTAAATAGPSPKISFPAVSFAVDRVDTTAGPTPVELSWTVADSGTGATQVRGTVFVQRFVGADPVGPALPIPFALHPEWPAVVFAGSGDVRSSNYTYRFLVPQYGPATTATWRVTEITASDDQGTTKTVFAEDLVNTGGQLRVTELVDSTAPAIAFFGRNALQPDIAFDPGSGVVLRYSVDITDAETGFWKGQISLAGPRGAVLTAPIELTDAGGYYPNCGPDNPVYDVHDVWCELGVNLPAGSPAGTWSVAAIELTDAADNTHRYTDVPSEPIAVTRNDPLKATDFALTPAQVDNWRQAQVVTLSMKPAGVQNGLVSITVWADMCSAATDVPTIAPDGTASVPVYVSPIVDRCALTGIALKDGAGNVAAYGSFYAAPVVDLTITRIPDTTPPVALAASLSSTSLPASNLPAGINVIVTVDDITLAPINGFSTTIYDARGVSVGGGSGGIGLSQNGVLLLPAYLRGLLPGTYTVGFTLFDAAGNHSQYGYPNDVGHPAPSGPLVFTVTPD